MTRTSLHLKNIASLAISGAWAKAFAFFTTVLLLKKFTVAENSAFQLALTIAVVLATIGEFGIRGFALRELARVRDSQVESQRMFSLFLTARVVGSVLLFPVAVAVLWGFSFSSQVQSLALWLLVFAVADAFAFFLKFVLRAYDRMEFDAVFSIVGRGLVLVILVMLARRGELTTRSAALAHVGGSIVELAALLVATRTVTGLRLLQGVDWRDVWNAVVRSIPFAVVNIVGLLYVRTGTIAVWKILGEDEVAYFVAASKIPEALTFFPIAVVNAMIPFLSRNYQDRALTNRYFTFILRYLGFCGIYVAVVFLVEPEFIIRLISTPEYLKASATFQWYGVYGFITFLQYAVLNFLICLNEERAVMRRYVASFVLNVVLNLLLVPRWGVTGAAIALVATEFATLVYAGHVLRRQNYHFPARAAIEILAAGAVVTVCLLLLRFMPALPRICVATVLFAALVAGRAWQCDRDVIHRLLGARRTKAGTLE